MMSVMLLLVNFKNGTNFQKKDLTDYNFFQNNGNAENFSYILDKFDTTYLRRAMPPTDSFAQPVIKCLQRAGHEVEIVTMNNEQAVPSIRGWCWIHGIDAKVVALGRGSAKEKAKHDYDWLIDDSPVLARVAHQYPNKIFSRYWQPWNDDVPVIGTNTDIVRGWLDVRQVALRRGIIED